MKKQKPTNREIQEMNFKQVSKYIREQLPKCICYNEEDYYELDIYTDEFEFGGISNLVSNHNLLFTVAYKPFLDKNYILGDKSIQENIFFSDNEEYINDIKHIRTYFLKDVFMKNIEIIDDDEYEKLKQKH